AQPALTRPSLLPPDYYPANPAYWNTPTGYTDFSLPWSITLDLTFGLTPAVGNRPVQRSAVLSITNFDLALTPNWKVAGRTGFDLERGELATTQLSVVRDLHCWEMRLNWIPFGAFRSFGFSLYVKSGYLRDLLRLDFPRADPLGRFRTLL
ncbi:MAG TPA: hypothetical protein VD962_06810, partial [Rubricoccaceae bacterium]|nr:hypothetical protein [Rubricoccaceae bacterium]